MYEIVWIDSSQANIDTISAKNMTPYLNKKKFFEKKIFFFIMHHLSMWSKSKSKFKNWQNLFKLLFAKNKIKIIQQKMKI